MKKIVLILTMLCGVSALADGKILTGTVTLEGKTFNVSVTIPATTGQTLTFNGDPFIVSYAGSDEVEASLTATENGKMITDKGLEIYPPGSSTMPQIKTKLSEVLAQLKPSNAAEAKCTDENNAFIIVADSLTNTLEVNCLTLK